MHRAVTRTASLALFAAALSGAAPAAGQIPDKFTNLKVLPADADKGQLVGVMKGFTGALGVRCEHCHAPKAGVETPKSLDDLDFPSDKNPNKEIARGMMKMVHAINTDYLAKFDTEHQVTVVCATCHRGVETPAPLEQVVGEALDNGGVAAAVERYRSLRNTYYGSGSYDFGEAPLARLASDLVHEERPADAIAMLQLDEEFFPDSSRVQEMLGESHLAAGDKEQARKFFVRALELDPDNWMAAKQMKALDAEAQPEPKPETH
jgi:tetratricopeptide (TPR) repeat protein